MFRTALALTVIVLAAPALAAGEIVRKASPHSVSETIDRLASIAESRGATIFARVDHAKGAASVDMPLDPAEALIFGNPKLGTPLMQEAPEMGLDLPLRALAYSDAKGQVWLIYHDPNAVARAHGLKGAEAAAKAIDGLTSAAIAE